MATLQEMLEAAMSKKNAPQIALDRREKVCQIADMYLMLTRSDLKKFKANANSELIGKASRFIAKLDQETAADILHLIDLIQQFIDQSREPDIQNTNIPLEFGKVLSMMTDAEINLWFEFETQVLEVLQK